MGTSAWCKTLSAIDPSRTRANLELCLENCGNGIVFHDHHAMRHTFRKMLMGEFAGVLFGCPDAPPELPPQRLRLSYGEINRGFQALHVKDNHLRPKGLGDHPCLPQGCGRLFAEIDRAQNIFRRKVIHRCFTPALRGWPAQSEALGYW